MTGAALALFSWRASVPGPWRDEVVTVEVATRSWSGIGAVVAQVDLVHAAYYSVVHLAAAALPDSVSALMAARSISVLAMTATVGMLFQLTLHLAGRGPAADRAPVVATLAAAAFSLGLGASRYAQEARPFALATALATGATLILVHAVTTCRPRPKPGIWTAYATLVVLTGLTNAVALLALAPQAVLVALYGRRYVRAWLAATTGAAVALLPFLAASFAQREQLAWRPPAAADDLLATLGLAWPPRTLTGAVLLISISLAVAETTRRGRRRSCGPPLVDLRLLTLALNWCVLPPVLLWLAGRQSSLFDPRYLVFCLPGAALTLAACFTARPRMAPRWSRAVAATLLIVLAVCGQASQRAVRGPVGHQEDVRGVALTLGRQARPGDAVLYRPAGLRLVGLALPSWVSELQDVSLAVPGRVDGSITGRERPPEETAEKLASIRRLWLVTGRSVPVDEPWAADPALREALARFSVTRELPTASWRVLLLEPRR